jgi:hypothetical protein
LATESRVREGEFGASRFERVVRDRSLAVQLFLSGALLLAFVVRLVLARRIATPWIMIDELTYSELAKNFAEHGDFLLRDQASPLYNLAYPALIAPAWLAESVATAYQLAQTINVLLMVAAALPVYFWAKRLMSPVQALLPVVLVLLMPSQIYSGMLMTENAFFVAVVLSTFLIALTLERPTLLRQALVLAAIGVTYFVRVQGIVLLAVYAVALGLKLVLDLRAPDGPRGFRHVLGDLRRYIPSAVAVLVLTGVYAAVKVRQGVGLESGLGAYGGVVKVQYDLSNASSWVIDHFAELTLSVAVIPLSALVVLLGLALSERPTSTAERAFLAVATSAFVLVVAQVGTYASRFSLRIEERNMFCVAPLLFMALSLWLARGLPRPPLLTAIAALGPAALLLALNLRSLLNIGILSDTFGLIPLLRLSDLIQGGTDTVELLMWGGALAAALAFALLPRKAASVVLPSAVALFLTLSSYSVFGAVRDHANATLAQTGASDPSWIDKQIGPSSKAAFLYGGTPDLVSEAQIMWQTEFWNRSVGPVYRLGPAEPAPLPEGAATLDATSGHIAVGPSSSSIRYMVAPSNVQMAGAILARQGRLALYRLDSPLRVETLLGGVYADGWMSSDAAFTYYGMPSQSRRLQIRLSRDSWSRPSPPGQVLIKIGPLVTRNGQAAIGKLTSSRTLTIRSRKSESVTFRTPKAPFRMEIHVDRTFSPSEFGLADPRQLGVQVDLRFVS